MLPNPLVPAVHPLGEGLSPADVTLSEVVTVSTPKGLVTIAWEMGGENHWTGMSFVFPNAMIDFVNHAILHALRKAVHAQYPPS